MFLSLLHIDVGNDPDRPRPGRLWLRNLHPVHQRLCMAFPTKSRKVDDPDFLKPFATSDFGQGQVHVRRDEDSGFLFRIDPYPGDEVPEALVRRGRVLRPRRLRPETPPHNDEVLLDRRGLCVEERVEWTV